MTEPLAKRCGGLSIDTMGDFEVLEKTSTESNVKIVFKTAVLIAISVAVRVAFIQLRPWDSVSTDVHSWFVVGHDLLNGENPYATTHVVNWPPTWPILLYSFAAIERRFGVWFGTSLFSTLIFVEQLLLVATTFLIRQFAPRANWFFVAFVGIAINPIAVFQTAQHGNFDVALSLCFVLMLMALKRYIDRGEAIDWVYACFFIGLAAVCKQVGLVLVPLLVPGLRRVPPRLWPLAGILVFGPVLFGIASIYIFCPEGVWEHVIQYRSISGFFGISGLLFAYRGDDAVAIYEKIFTSVLAGSLLGLCVFLFWRRAVTPQQMLLTAILLLVGVSTLGPGWGLQYVYWWLPMALAAYVAFEDRWLRGILLGAYAIMGVTYTVQYAANPELGWFVLNHHPSVPVLSAIRDNWLDAEGQTWLRLPLFAVLIVLLAAIARLLCRRETTTVAA